MALLIQLEGRPIYAKISGFKASLRSDGECFADIRVQYFASREQRLTGPGFGQFAEDIGPRPEVFLSLAVENPEPTLAEAYTALRALDRFAAAQDA